MFAEKRGAFGVYVVNEHVGNIITFNCVLWKKISCVTVISFVLGRINKICNFLSHRYQKKLLFYFTGRQQVYVHFYHYD